MFWNHLDFSLCVFTLLRSMVLINFIAHNLIITPIIISCFFLFNSSDRLSDHNISPFLFDSTREAYSSLFNPLSCAFPLVETRCEERRTAMVEC